MNEHPPSTPPGGAPDRDAPQAERKSSSLQEREDRAAAWAQSVKRKQIATSESIANPVADEAPEIDPATAGESFDVNLLFTNSARLAAEEQTRRDLPAD